MKRSGPIKRKTPMRAKGGHARAEALSPERRREIASQAAVVRWQTPAKPRAVMALCIGPATPQPKAPVQRDQRIRDSARDEQCLVRLPGCIGHERGATIWSHYRGSAGGKGMGLKASDVCGSYACTACDAVWDGQRPRPAGMTQLEVSLAWHEGHIRSLGRLHAKGLL